MTEVLIIGAGPTGLMMACQLSILNIPFRLIDKNEDHTTQSRAIVIHAASMELFAQMGIADRFLQLGKQVTAINYLVKRKTVHIPLFSAFGKGLSEFPFFLALEQSKTEQLLVDFLEQRGCFVERNTELVSLTQTAENVTAIVRQKDGKEESIAANYLIGADGASSLVRHHLQIPFDGETYPLDLFVLDCKISWPLKDDELTLAFSDTSFAGFFPLPEGRCRVISFVPKELSGKTELSFGDITKDFASRMQLDIQLYDPGWISTYRAHHRYVSQFRKGRCFLAGDAAHVHSPVGAQGMNTGLQDAFNLAWKLALVLKGTAKDRLLSSYEEERLPFARQLVRTTDRAFGIVVSNHWMVKVMRMHVAPFLLRAFIKRGVFAKYMFKTVSQIGITYSDSIAISHASTGAFPSTAPKPGTRLPYIEFESTAGKRINIQQLIRGRMQVLVFDKTHKEASGLERLLQKYVEIAVLKVPFTKGSAELYRLLGISQQGYYLVRPDLYVAYRCNNLDTEQFSKFLDSFLQQ